MVGVGVGPALVMPINRWFRQALLLVLVLGVGFILGVKHERLANAGTPAPARYQNIYFFNVQPGQGPHKVSIAVHAGYTVLARPKRWVHSFRSGRPCMLEATTAALTEQNAEEAYFALTEGMTSLESAFQQCLQSTLQLSVAQVELRLIHVVDRGRFLPERTVVQSGR